MCEKLKQTIYGRNTTTKSRKIRTPEEKKTYEYLTILEADTIKQVEIKEKKLKKSISGGRENYSEPNYIVEISSKG